MTSKTNYHEDIGKTVGIVIPKNQLISAEDLYNLIEELCEFSCNLGVNKIFVSIPGASEELREGLNSLNKKYTKKLWLCFSDARKRMLSEVTNLLNKVSHEEIKLSDIDETFFNKNIINNSEIDLLIKFGRKKLPESFMWEISYSELFFIESFANFDKNTFKNIIEKFEERDRRFGR